MTNYGLQLTKADLSTQLFLLLHRTPVQESVSKRIKVAEGLLGIHCQGIARDDSFDVSVHERSEAVSGWLWPNSAARKIFVYEIPEAKTSLIHPTSVISVQATTT